MNTILRNQQCKNFTGTSETLAPASGHDSERFTVNGVQFQFSDFDISGFGYNNAKSHAGAIDQNKYVKIGYIKIENSNQILKLEVRK